MMCLSINRVDMPMVPMTCLYHPGRYSIKQIMCLWCRPIVPKGNDDNTNARAYPCDTYTYTMGTIGIGIKWLFYLNKSCPGWYRRCVGTIGIVFRSMN